MFQFHIFFTFFHFYDDFFILSVLFSVQLTSDTVFTLPWPSWLNWRTELNYVKLPEGEWGGYTTTTGGRRLLPSVKSNEGKVELSHIVLAHFKSTHIKMCPMNYGLERKSLPHIAAHMNLLILDPHMRVVEGGTARIGDITPYPSCHRRRLFMSSKFIFHFHELQTIASTHSHSHALLSSLSRRLARFFMADFTVAICLPLQNIMLWNVNI